MRKRLLISVVALFIALAWLPGGAFAAVDDNISNLLRQGDTGNLVTIDDFTFLGHNIIGLDIETAKNLMELNDIYYTTEADIGEHDNYWWAGGTIRGPSGEWGARVSFLQYYSDDYVCLWSYDDALTAISGHYCAPIGVKDIQMHDSLETVLQKLGFTTATQVASAINHILSVEYESEDSIRTNLRNTNYGTDNGYFGVGNSLGYGRDSETGKWTISHLPFIVSFYAFPGSFQFEFEDGQLVRYSVYVFQSGRNQADDDPTYNLYDEFILPSESLNFITDIPSAVSAVSALTKSMTNIQKSAPDCIDLATLYAETAASKVTTYPVSGETISINASVVSALKATAVEASEAVETALTDGGVTTARYLSKTIIFTTDEQDISIQIDPDVLTIEVDKIRVETPTYAVTFKLSDLEPDLTQSLTFTAQDMRTGYAAGSSSGKATVKVGLPNGRTTNSITVSLPSDSGDTTYQAVVSTDGQATASKYNPATTTMDGKINTSGTYTVKSNEKDFTDISGKSAEMQTAIRYLASKGIISGTTATTFSPDGSINRAEIATLLVKALGKLDSTATASFSDVTKGNWFYTAAASSQRHGLINGYEDNTFRGTTNISKVQIVAVSSRVLTKEMGYKVPSNPSAYLAKYNDSVDSWAQSEVALATKENLVVYRTDGTFSGNKNMTRGDAAIIIYRLFQRIW